MLTSRVSIGSEDISWGSRKNPFIEIPFPDDWHWIFLPSCSVSVKAVYSSFAIWNRAHGHLLISLHPTCFCVQPRLNAERSQYKWRFQSIYLSVQPRLNARDRCKSDFILPVDIFREARRGLSDKYLLRSQRVSPIIYWAKIIQYNPHWFSTEPKVNLLALSIQSRISSPLKWIMKGASTSLLSLKRDRKKPVGHNLFDELSLLTQKCTLPNSSQQMRYVMAEVCSPASLYSTNFTFDESLGFASGLSSG